MKRLDARLRARSGDRGFTLVEVIVALGLLATVMLALLSTSLFAAGATVAARQNQQAADYLNQAIEAGRALDYGGASMLISDLGTDPNIVTVGGVKKYDPQNGNGLETIDATNTGTVTPHIATSPTTNNGTFTIKRYVTVPSTATFNAVTGLPSVRRLTVEVSWTTRAKTHVKRTSTLMTLTRRGLPLPRFTWKYNGPATMVGTTPTWVKNPGNSVAYGFVLTNLGARDGWRLSASTSGWTFYSDTNKDGLWSGSVTTEPMLNPADTGLIEPSSAPVYVVAYRTTSTTDPTGTSSTTFTATSDAFASDPDALTLYSKSVTTTLILQTGAVVTPTASPTPTPTPTSSTGPTCTPTTTPPISSSGSVAAASTGGSYSLTPLNLYNSAVVGDSTTVDPLGMGRDSAQLEPKLCNWSTDLQTNQAGRYLAASTDAAASAVAKTVEFRYQPASAAQDQYRGIPSLTFWVQCTTTSGTQTITATLGSLSGTTYTNRATANTIALSGCTTTGFQRYSLAFSGMTTFTIGLTDKLVLRLQANEPVRLGFGSTDVPALFTIGMR